MIKIGEFSRLAHIPVATLRYYDQLGLLRPVSVDQATGYRYYAADQLPQLHRILALKGLGLSLEQVASALAEGVSVEQMRGMLRLRRAQLTAQIADSQRQLAEVERRLGQVERGDARPAYEVRLKQAPPMLIASVRELLADHHALGHLYDEVHDAIVAHDEGALVTGPGGVVQTLVLWYDTEFKESDVDGEAAYLLRRPIPERGRVKVRELPAATVASTLHHGDYMSMGDAHEALLTWVEGNGYRFLRPDRELYLHYTEPVCLDNPEYITEVQYPIAPRGPEPRGHAEELS